jgi:UDP-GlcNAc:undecaprenyl-phosphate GlcNAc-1-phosphate transferase
MVLAVVRRTARGMSPFDADREHLHHRLLNLGHSVRSAVLLMYLWAALFSALVVGLSVVRISLIWFAVLTVGAFAALLLATAPKLRPWHNAAGSKHALATGSRLRSEESVSATAGLASSAPPGPGADAGGLPPLPAHLAAPVGPPVPGMPPPGMNNGTGHNGTSHNGTGPHATGPQATGRHGSATGPRHRAHGS